MPKPWLNGDERRQRLDEAREALQWGDTRTQREALKRLPEDGAKAAALRAQLEHRLRGAQMQLPLVVADRPRPGPLPVPEHVHECVILTSEVSSVAPVAAGYHVSGGFRYRFSLAEVDSSALFHVRAKGADAVIVLNSAHPAVHDIMVSAQVAHSAEPEVHLAFRRLLLAWARLELEGPVGAYRDRLQQVREDLGRLMRGGDL